jgi:uncharacterized protein YjbI with pentapeptide repeats
MDAQTEAATNLQEFTIYHDLSGKPIYQGRAARMEDLVAQALQEEKSLQWARLRWLNFHGMTLDGLYVVQGDLTGSALGSCKLLGSTLTGVTAPGIELSDSDLSGSRLIKSDFSSGPLNRSTAHKATFDGSDLSGSNWSFMDLTGSTFISCDMRGIILSRCILSDCDFTDANLEGAVLTDCIMLKTKLCGARLLGAMLGGSLCDQTDLTGAHQVGCRIWGAVLKNAIGVDLELSTPMEILLHQPGKLRAFLAVDPKETPHVPMARIITPKEPVTVGAKGWHRHHVAMNLKRKAVEKAEGKDIPDPVIPDLLEVEFKARDITEIPYGSIGDFLVCKFKVIRRLREFGDEFRKEPLLLPGLPGSELLH